MPGNRLVRTAAITAAIFKALAVLLAVPGIWMQILNFPRQSWRWLALPMTIGGLAVDAILPVFCVAVFMSKHRISVPQKQGFIARLAGFVFVLLAILGDESFGVGGRFWSRSHGTGFFHDLRVWFTPVGIGGTFGMGAYLTGQLVLISYGVMLVALSRCEGGGDAVVSDSFRKITKIAVLVWGVIALGAILRLLIMPFVYFNLFAVARANGRTPPGIGSILRYELLILVPWICFFIGPNVIRKGFQGIPPALKPDAPIPQQLGS